MTGNGNGRPDSRGRAREFLEQYGRLGRDPAAFLDRKMGESFNTVETWLEALYAVNGALERGTITRDWSLVDEAVERLSGLLSLGEYVQSRQSEILYLTALAESIRIELLESKGS